MNNAVKIICDHSRFHSVINIVIFGIYQIFAFSSSQVSQFCLII